jgi:1-acyl-sn-glycerol-3-phosphate acyltransferase
MPNWIVKYCQILVYPIVYVPFRVLYKKRLLLKFNLSSDEKYIFTANHPSRIDPFLMFYLMPFKELIKILPLRFMTAKIYMNNLIKYLLMSMMGCYKIEDDVITKSKNLLENNNNLCIFIQGRMDAGFKSKPKVGAICIERDIKNSFIVPVNITYSHRNLRKTATIIFKKKFRHVKFPKNLQPLANKLLENIRL